MKKLIIAASVFAAGSTFLVSNPAKAVDCSTGLGTVGEFVSLGGCTIGGYTFTYSTGNNTYRTTDKLTVSASGSQITFSIQGDPSPWAPSDSPLNLNYSVAAPSGKYLSEYSSFLSRSGGTANQNQGTYNITGAAGIAAATFATPTGVGGQKMYTNTTTLLDNYTSSMNVGTGLITQNTATFDSNPIPTTSQVPAPLPLLGLAGAFGFSRNIRRRIRANN